jgi:hypothetical protein
MPINYAGLKSTAERLIRENGRAATIIRKGENVGPAHTPIYEPDTEHLVLIVELPKTQPNIESLRLATEVVDTDKILLISTEGGTAPMIGDVIRDGLDGSKYQVVALSTLVPGPTVLLYKALVRK